MLEKNRDQTFVAGALPDEPGRHRAGITQAMRLSAQLGERARRVVEQIGAPIQQADVDEPGQRVERSVPPRGFDRRGHEVVCVGRESVERQHPAGGGEFRDPDHVELQYVGRFRPCVQPLHIELMALIRGIRRDLQVHADAGMLVGEPRKLTADHVALGTERAAGKGEPWQGVVGAAGRCHERDEEHAQPCSMPHAPHLAVLLNR